MKSNSAESIAAVDSSAIDGSLPAGWRIDNFERLAVLQRGFDLPSSARTTGDVPIIGSNGIVGWHSEARARGPGVVTGRSGSIGESTYIEGDYWPLNTSLYVSHFYDNIPRFVHYFILWFDLSRFASGVSVPTLNRNSVYGTEVKIPSPREQGKIAAVLWKLQRAIATQDRLIATTRDLKQSAMQRLFTHGLRGEPLKETTIGPMPESWQLLSLGDLGRIGNGSTPKKTHPEYWLHGKTPWLTSGKIHEGIIFQADQFVSDIAVNECHLPLVPAGSLLVAITGQGKTLGNAALVDFDTTINQHLAYVRFEHKDAHAAFVYQFMRSRYEELQAVGRAGGSTKAALTCAFLRDFPIPFPSEDEQREIAAALTTIDRKLAHHQKKRAALNDLFQTLLHKLMTGEIRVADIDIDTSEITAPPGAPS